MSWLLVETLLLPAYFAVAHKLQVTTAPHEIHCVEMNQSHDYKTITKRLKRASKISLDFCCYLL